MKPDVQRRLVEQLRVLAANDAAPASQQPILRPPAGPPRPRKQPAAAA